MSTKNATDPDAEFKVTRARPIAGRICRPKSEGEEFADDCEYTKVDGTAKYIKKESEDDQAQLQVVLKGGFRKDQDYAALFDFQCDPNSKEPTNPIPHFFNKDDEDEDGENDEDEDSSFAKKTLTTTFDWKTKHACPLHQHATPNPKSPTRTHHHHPEKTDDSEIPLIDKDSTPGKGRMFWTVGSLCLLSLGIYGAYSVYSRKTGYTLLGQAEPPSFSKFGGGGRYSLPPFSPDTIIGYLKRPFRRRQVKLGGPYHPLVAEEYEIPDIEGDGDEEGGIVDFQKQAILDGQKKIKRGSVGYGTVR